MCQLPFIKERPYNRSYQVQGGVREFISYVDFQFISLWSVGVEKKEKRLLMNPTFVARITGAGNVPETSVVLKYETHCIRRRFEQQLRETHRREYPSGANCSLTMSREVLTIEAETPRDSVARSRIKE
jgi:hypothetical protein